MSQTYTIKQVADILGYSTNSIYEFVKEKRIKAVRIGRGRFRITEEELQRVMHLSKKNNQDVAMATQTTDQTQATPQTISQQNTNAFIRVNRLKKETDTTLPRQSLLDWFIIITSILVGISLFLFSNHTISGAVATLLPWKLSLRVVLITAGIGLLLSQHVGRFSKFWNIFFRLILTASFLLIAYFRWQILDGDGAMLAIILACAIIGSIFLSIENDIMSFALVIFLDSILAPLVIFVSPSRIVFPEPFNSYAAQNTFLFGAAWLTLGILNIVIIRTLYLKNRLGFYLYIYFYAIVILAISFWCAYTQNWTKAVVFLTISCTCFLIPVWERISAKNAQAEIKSHIKSSIFGILLIILSGLLGVFLVIERNAKEIAIQKISDKNEYARQTAVSIYSNAQNKVIETAKNPAFVAYLSNTKDPKLTQEIQFLLKDLVITKAYYVRTAGVMDITGKYHAAYPYDKIIETKLFNTSKHFLHVTANKNTFVSDVFDSNGTIKRPSVVVATPVFSETKQMAGILVASLDLVRIGNNLQKISFEDLGESITLVDANSRVITDKDPKMIGKFIPNAQNINSIDESDRVVTSKIVSNDRYYYQSASRIPETKWALIVQAPLASLLSMSRFLLYSLYLGASLGLLCLIFGTFYVIDRIFSG